MYKDTSGWPVAETAAGCFAGHTEIPYLENSECPRIGWSQKHWLYSCPSQPTQALVLDDYHVASLWKPDSHYEPVRLSRVKKHCPLWLWQKPELQGRKWRKFKHARREITLLLMEALAAGVDTDPEWAAAEGLRLARLQEINEDIRDLQGRLRKLHAELVKGRYESLEF